MKSQNDFDEMIEAFIETERSITANPFLSTRIMASIEGKKRKQHKFYPTWQNIAMSLGVILAIFAGIKAGSLYHTSQIKNDHATIIFMNDDKMEHFVFYQQTANE
ncbi:MAG TPA: hypothetical protein VNT20_18235 [Flavisolibacter sp.]|jgi:hypothetical protein|nr:hypothetical protein [Flavisolibacter sp.]